MNEKLDKNGEILTLLTVAKGTHSLIKYQIGSLVHMPDDTHGVILLYHATQHKLNHVTYRSIKQQDLTYGGVNAMDA